jgi:raffinose/stachyose/melibiose transport system substrate-binding protein
MARASFKGPKFRRRAGALLGAALTASTVGMVAAAIPAAASSSVPTATITLWPVPNGTNLDNYWASQAKAFDQANPGDKVNIVLQSSSNSYKAKVQLALASSSPPTLFFSWGGGDMFTDINAKVDQPFGDAGQSDAGDPSWKSDFLPSSLGAVTFNGNVYGIPIAGTQPVFFFYNKPLLAKYGLSFPKTTTQLISDVVTLAKHNVTAIGLGNADEWEGLMYLEYFSDREGGPQVFLNIQDKKPGAWSNPAIIKALYDIQTLVNDNAFEKGYDSISWGNGFIDALVYGGVAASELMGDWDIGNFTSDDPSFVSSGKLGVAPFPTVPGGKGNPADLEGNTTSYYGMAAHISPAQTYVAEQFVKFAFTTTAYAKYEVSQGLVPVIAGTASLLNASPLKNYLVPIYNAVEKAPSFQYSWDQALGLTRATPMLDNLAKVFDLLESPQQFAKIMNAYQ